MPTQTISHLSVRCFSASIAISISFFCVEKVRSATSDWENQPKPAFPAAALANDAEGAVKVRIVVKKNGNVDHAVITKGSGNKELDEAAQRGVQSWKMKPDAVKPSDLVRGRDVIIDFREEAAIAARYPERVVASFSHFHGADMWRSAPFPSYPMDARLRHEQGAVRLKLKIGSMGNVEQVDIFQSSGHKVLDDAAIVAVRHWKAHPQYAGRTVVVPINFQIGFRR